MKRYAFFPGCSAESTGLAFTKSSAYVAERIGFEMEEIPDWSCCGTSAAKLTNHELGQALSARNLAIAETMEGRPDVVAACAGCYQALKGAREYVRESDAHRERIEELTGLPYSGTANVVSLLEAFSDPEVSDAIKAEALKPLRGLKVACYYGCAIVRPNNINGFDDPENPQSMDELLRAVGAEPVDWAFKTECCGGSQTVAMPGVAKPLVERIFQNAVANGAECIVTTCPLCQLNLDMREAEVNRSRTARGLEPFDIPCFFFTELIGAALGGQVEELGVDIHFHPASEFLAETELRALRILAEEKAAAEEAAKKEAERAAKIAAAKAAKEAKAKKAAESKAAETGGAGSTADKPSDKQPKTSGAVYRKPTASKEEKKLRQAQEALAAKQAELQAAHAVEEKLREELATQAEKLARAQSKADARAAFESLPEEPAAPEASPTPEAAAPPPNAKAPSEPPASDAPSAKEVSGNE